MKYKFTNETKIVDGHTLHRIECVESFFEVTAGDKGGWIEKKSNLSQNGNCWVDNDARVYGNARVYGDALVRGNAIVSGNAKIESSKDYLVFKNNWSSFRYFTWTRSNDMWEVGCFYGTGEELIKKAYADSENSGKHYEATVNFVEQLKAMEE